MDEKISLIISVYKNYDYLEIVLKSLEKQTYKIFEVIIAEDASELEMIERIKKWKKEYFFEIQHVSQEDIGFRKTKILNKAIKTSIGTNIVIIDGDCMVHPKFLYNYDKYFSMGYGLVFGRRCELSKILTEKIIEKKGNYKISLFDLMFLKSKAWTESVYLPNIPRKKRRLRLLGSNMGFTKESIYKINGFDEDYEGACIGEDTDLQWRFLKAEVKYIATKNILIQYHLNHGRNDRANNTRGLEMLKEKQSANFWKPLNGLKKLS